MLTRTIVDTVQVPGGAELQLVTHGRDFIIVLDRNELMSTRMQFSEQQLAVMTLDRVEVQNANVLIGGYGMGFTLRAALAEIGDKARVTVAELVPEIINWARGPMAEITQDCLDDPRVILELDDVAEVIGDAADMGTQYDAILLDVDNGPDGLVHDGNNRIYSKTGLGKARDALHPDGVLAIWSAGPDPQFVRRLGNAGFHVEEVEVRARPNNKGPRHWIWFARPKPGRNG